MIKTKTCIDADGASYTDWIENGKLVKRQRDEANHLNTWERKGPVWIWTITDKQTNESTTSVVPFPPTPAYPLKEEPSETLIASK